MYNIPSVCYTEPANKDETGHAMTTARETVEEIPLVSDVDELEEDIASRKIPSNLWLSPSAKSHVKLLLYKSSFFVIGVAVLVAGGVVSHYTSPSSSLNCSEPNTTDINNSTLLVAPSNTVSALSTVDPLSPSAIYPYMTPSPTSSMY